MERFNMIYSEKNIPIPSKEDYKIQLISKTEKFIKRMRWKALEFLGNLHSSDKITFGSKSRNCPPIVEELENFENELMFMIKKIQFRKVNNSFQRQLNEDITQIKRDSKIFGSANIRNKNNASFIVFDIERFYPPISLELFHEAINFVKTICDIPEKDISIIMQSR